MRITAILVLVYLVAFTAYAPLAAHAATIVHPDQGCPAYLTSLVVDLVNSSPIQVTVGDVVTTTFHVIYPDGTPATLAPQTASFLWVGAAGSTQFDDVNVTFTGSPGFYNYAQTITGDLLHATVGSSVSGGISVYLAACSCADASGNRGPTGNIGSDSTLTPSDNSNLNIGPQTRVQQQVSFLVPTIIGLLIIASILLLFRRSRSKKRNRR